MRHVRPKLAARTLAALTAGVFLVAMAAGGGAQAAGALYGDSAYAIGFTGVTVQGKAIPNETLGTIGAYPPGGGHSSAPLGTLTLPDGMGSLTVTGANADGASGTAGASYKISKLSLLPNLTEADVRTLCLPLLACVPSLVTAGRGPVPLLDISLVQSSSSASATKPAAHRQRTQVGAITLLGGSVQVPLSTTPDSTVNLGLLSITLHGQSYDAPTNTASAQAVILHFPANGALSPAITGTITIASTSVSAEPAASRNLS